MTAPRQGIEWTGLLEAFEALYMSATRLAISIEAHNAGVTIDQQSWGALREQLEELEEISKLVRAELHEAEEIPEFTRQDFEHSLSRAERHRMMRGEFLPGDIEKLRKWCRLSPEEMAQALTLPDVAFLRKLDEAGLSLPSAFGSLLRIAARNPGALRALLQEQP